MLLQFCRSEVQDSVYGFCEEGQTKLKSMGSWLSLPGAPVPIQISPATGRSQFYKITELKHLCHCWFSARMPPLIQAVSKSSGQIYPHFANHSDLCNQLVRICASQELTRLGCAHKAKNLNISSPGILLTSLKYFLSSN